MSASYEESYEEKIDGHIAHMIALSAPMKLRTTDLLARDHILDAMHSGEGLLAALRPETGPHKRARRESDTGSDKNEGDPAGESEARQSVEDDPSEADGPRKKSRRGSDTGSEKSVGDLAGESELRESMEIDSEGDEIDEESDSPEYLAQLENEIRARYSPASAAAPATLRLLPATVMRLRAEDTTEGLGKTLALLLAINVGHRLGDGPSVIVVPSSSASQWMEEIKANFVQETMPALHLVDPNTSPFDLGRYRIVVTSYNYVVAEHKRIAKFVEDMESYRQGKNSVVPKRPTVCLLSGVWKLPGAKPIGRYLVLDEADAIKDRHSRAYAAIKELRESCVCCLPITGSPLDGTWADVFAQ